MKNRDRDYIYAVPFIGGIICLVSLFAFNLSAIFTLGPLGLIGILIFIHPQVVLGIMMIVSAIRTRNGKTMWIEQKKKLLVISWVLVGISLGFTIFFLLIIGMFYIMFEYGFVGGLLTLIGYYYDKYTTSRASLTGPALIRTKDNLELGPMKERVIFPNPKFCPKCGIDLKGSKFKFCTDCGNQLAF